MALLLGHAKIGVQQAVYFADAYKPAQLNEALKRSSMDGYSTFRLNRFRIPARLDL